MGGRPDMPKRHVDEAAGPQDSLKGGDAEDNSGKEWCGEQENEQEPVSSAMPGDKIRHGPC